MYVGNYLEYKKFVYYDINLYSRTRRYILDRVKIFSIIVGNLLKICIFVSTITKNKKKMITKKLIDKVDDAVHYFDSFRLEELKKEDNMHINALMEYIVELEEKLEISND